MLWVTALTVASLLLGGGALTAFAEHGGKGNGGGKGNSAAHQQQQPATQKPEVEHQNRNHDVDDDDLITQPDRVTDEVRPGKGCGDENHEHERHDECKSAHGDDDNDAD